MIYTHIALLANQIVQLEKENRTLAENQAALLKQADDCAHMQEERLKEINDTKAKLNALTAMAADTDSTSPSASTYNSAAADTTDDESPDERDGSGNESHSEPDDSGDEDFSPTPRAGKKLRGGKKRGRRGRGSGWHHTTESKAKMSAAKKEGCARKRAALLLDFAGATEPPSPTGYNAGLPTGSTPTSPTPTDVETAA